MYNILKRKAAIVGDNILIYSASVPEIMKESIKSSAVNSIRSSQEFANTYAKSLMMDVLCRDTARSEFGYVLQTVFKNEFVLGPTRNLTYWSLFLPATTSSAFSTTKSQVEYFCTHPEGLAYSKEQLATLMSWWIQHEKVSIVHRQENLISPLVIWALEQQEGTVNPLSVVVANSLPNIQKVMNEALVYGVLTFLKSNEAR